MLTENAVSLLSGCRWVEAPGERAGQSVETWNLSAMLGFDVLRIFWLTGLAQDQWRGRHAHLQSILATFAVVGSCELVLDDGRRKQIVELRDDGPGLIIGPMIWHELQKFSSDATIVVAASTRYDESEYMRDYAAFVEEVIRNKSDL